MNSFILKGDIAYSRDLLDIETIENGYLVCIEGKSAGAFKELPDEYANLELIDCEGKLIIPGMVDLHIHAPQYAFRGMHMDLELMDWLSEYTFPEECKYEDLDYAAKAYDVFAECMRRSATSRACIFSTVHKDATKILMDKLEASGLKTYVGKVNMDLGVPDKMVEGPGQADKNTREWIETSLSSYKNTLPILTPRFIPACSKELLEVIADIDAEYKLPVQSHLSENPEEIRLVSQMMPEANFYGDAYDRFGLFGTRGKAIMAHCVYSSEEEIELIKQNGVYVAHCPSSNLNLSSGIAPIRRYIERGLNIGLGSDVAGGESESIFSAIKKGIEVSKMYWRYIDKDSPSVKFSEMFYLATLGGGSFFGKVGSFDKGYEFDALVLDESLIPHPLSLSVLERLERAVYLRLDKNGIIHKYVSGKKVL